MKLKKLTTILLLIAMLLPLASCGNGGKDSDTETQGNVSAESDTTGADTAESETTRADYPDDLPEKDFGGKTYTVLGEGMSVYFHADELNGEVLNDALYNRDVKVGERFNAKIALSETADAQATIDTAKASVQAGEDEYAAVVSFVIYMGMAVTNNIFQPVSDLPYINLNQPWWSASNLTDLTYRGKTFLVMGDFDMSGLSQTKCMFYNKDLAESFGLPNIYETVRNGQWTKDKINELCEGTYVDVNGDGQKDAGDQYGYAVDSKGDFNGLLWAFGKRLFEQQSDGTYKDVYYDEKLVSIVEWCYDIKNNHDYTWTDSEWNTGYNMFMLEKTLIANGYISMTQWGMRDLEADYAILPCPKWDEAQQNYYTYVEGSHSIAGVLTTAQDKEFVGCIMEALNAESWKTVRPAYYDSCLKYKGARDEDSVEMLDILMDGRLFDFGYVYGGWGAAFWLQYCINDENSTDITSYYEKKKNEWNTYMDKVFTAFDDFTQE